MAREIIWAEPAWRDLETAADFIGRDSESYASAFVQRVMESATFLTEFAEMGQIVPEIGDETIRELLVNPYRLIYEISDDQVLILALIQGARRTGRF